MHSADRRWLHRALGAFGTAVLLLVGCASSPRSLERVGAPGCGERVGRTVELAVENVDERADSVLVHLPPCYDSESRSYPTLWLMHGGATTADMWVDFPLDTGAIADALALDGTPFLVAMPNGASGRPEFLAGEFETVLAAVGREFRTIDHGRARAIAGISAGGTTAAYLAAENEATDFAALGLFMTVWGPTLNERFPEGVAARELAPEVLVDIGEDDGLRTYSDDVESSLDAAGVVAEIGAHPGGHDLVFVASRLETWMQWLAARFS